MLSLSMPAGSSFAAFPVMFGANSLRADGSADAPSPAAEGVGATATPQGFTLADNTIGRLEAPLTSVGVFDKTQVARPMREHRALAFP